MAATIELEGVSKTFGSKKAVDNITLRVEQGTVLALLGPNGAGKTTTISMMLGLQHPTSGTVRLLGGDPREPQNRQRVGAMLQDVNVIDRLTVRETIELFRSYYKTPMSLEKLLNHAGLTDKQNDRAEKLSGGQKRRLNFALALAGDPAVLFVDEPTVGMDVTARRAFWETLREFANEGRTIVLTTHYLEEADAIADRIVVINQGKLTADGTPSELKTALGGKYVSFIAGGDVTHEKLQTLPGVEDIEWSGRHVRLRTKQSDQLLFAIVRGGLDVRDIEVKSGGLEDVFSVLTESNSEETHIAKGVTV
jgi:ABC-2 type transport system ATP-binding protein